MPPRLVSRFLLRAPLLPLSALRRPAEALLADPLGAQAVALASPDLAAALQRRPTTQTHEALDRYGRRAAFRATPHGLLAGVGVGQLGARTAIATGTPRGHHERAWADAAVSARAALDVNTVRLRVAPSLAVHGREAVWLALGGDGDGLQVRRAEVDQTLAAVLAATATWTAWSGVREAVDPDDPEAADELLLLLVDQGLLHHDREPPLIGRPLSGQGRLHTVLVHECPRATLSTAAVTAAASVAPLLFRLQEALSPPGAERDLGAQLREHLAAIEEIFGAGAYDVPALLAGGFGAALASVDEAAPQAVPPPTPLLEYLVERLGAEEVALDPDELDRLLPFTEPPPTFELVLTPCREPPRARPGTGWLLGLHAPAGASWGRYAHAVGTEALAELAAMERDLEERLDVSFAPTPDLADLCRHPPVRRRSLALVGWPEGEAVAVKDLQLVLDGGVVGLRDHAGQPVCPSPLHRVRSTTAPSGLYRLLAGWSFQRQHAPWAFGWGALAQLPRLPRVSIGGFVVAPASWGVPHLRSPRDLSRWRASAGLPRFVQMGEGDELLLVDLEQKPKLTAGTRLFEVWPPLDRTIDRDGRRIEAVVAVVCDTKRPIAGTRPVRPMPASGWTTYKLFGAEDRQDQVLRSAVAPLVRQAQAAGTIDRWFFQRYVEQRRDHLRLRVRGDAAAFAFRLAEAIAPLREAGDLVTVETAEYFPEIARYGGEECYELVEKLFELDSELVIRLLEVETEEADRVELLVRSFDALAQGLGQDLEGRRRMARGRRDAAAPWLDREHDAEYRARQRRLAAVLAGTADDGFAAVFDAHATRVRALGVERSLDDVLGSLLHVCAVRLAGARPDDEAAAYFFWERALEGLSARRRR